MGKETETVPNPPMVRQNHLTEPQSLQQAMELQSQATMRHLPTTALLSLPMVSRDRDSLHLVLGNFKFDIVGISIFQTLTLLA